LLKDGPNVTKPRALAAASELRQETVKKIKIKDQDYD
jgi:hypothetical protein